MPNIIDPETINVDELPGIWSPVQWDLSEEERNNELEEQATANLLWAVDIPEAILRLLLDECAIERAFDPPKSYDPEQQGEWDENLLTFQFKREIQLRKVEREKEYLYLEYKIEDFGYWAFEIRPEQISVFRI